MKAIDLFAGIGGISLGLKQAGIEVIYANDNDEKCQVTYQKNFESTWSLKDITRETNAHFCSVVDEIAKLDFQLLAAGFPCQTFSKAGEKTGFVDKKGRGELFFYLLAVLARAQPEIIFLENVANLVTHNQGQTFGLMLEKLTTLGYFVQFKVLKATQFGNLPQNRERVYILGWRKKSCADNFRWADEIPLTNKFEDFLETMVAQKYYYDDKPLGKKLHNYQLNSGSIYLWRRSTLRTYNQGICPTLLANMGVGGHNVPLIVDKKGIRKLTPRECARLQGFPDDFVLPLTLADKHLYRQLGNSVAVPVIRRIVGKL